MAERDRIARFFSPLSADEPGSFALTDDAAIITPPAGKQLVITTDSVIESIHLLASASAQQFAQKLVRRNMSDLAAMGATPWRYSLNLHTPHGLSHDWFAAFAATLHAEQTAFGMVLIGGDSTSGAGNIHATLTCFGITDAASLRRNGAKAGDHLYVSGTLGDAAYALALLQQNQPIDASIAERYFAPTPRLGLGTMLRGIASSCIDVSDGLLSDIAQLCRASGCGARIEQSALPLSAYLKNAALSAATKFTYALSGGDDYELCFTAPETAKAKLKSISEILGLPLTRIGTITADLALSVRDENGRDVTPAARGFEHT